MFRDLWRASRARLYCTVSELRCCTACLPSAPPSCTMRSCATALLLPLCLAVMTSPAASVTSLPPPSPPPSLPRSLPRSPVPSPRPHVFMMLADDWGSYDASYRMRELGRTPDIETPNIDALGGGAKGAGLRLSEYYVQPICTPTRAGLLTGRYSIHTGSEVRQWWPGFTVVHGGPVASVLCRGRDLGRPQLHSCTPP